MVFVQLQVNIRWSHLPVEGGHPAQIHFHLCDVAQELVHAVDVGNQDDLKDNRIKTAPRSLVRDILMRVWNRMTSIDYQSCTNVDSIAVSVFADVFIELTNTVSDGKIH